MEKSADLHGTVARIKYLAHNLGCISNWKNIHKGVRNEYLYLQPIYLSDYIPFIKNIPLPLRKSSCHEEDCEQVKIRRIISNRLQL